MINLPSTIVDKVDDGRLISLDGMMKKHPKPEIMSPAGYWPQLQAAVEAGADAIYFGLNHFTARAKVGFTLDELPDVMKTLHQRGVKGYVTFNTLIFDHELSTAVQALTEIAKAGADSVIVQDIGIAQLAREIAPELEVHGSTQMSITSAEGIALAEQFGVSRVVLARELSIKEVAQIRTQTECELEMFVHGALCVSYSGQCFSSEAWGGRSANRGQCAQACRLPYQMIVDGEFKQLADSRYLLSPGDLYALQQIPEIVDIGISALKIEGRYKDANYVALTTQAYRKAVDEAYAGLELSVTPEEELQIEQVYSRGMGPYFVSGVNHQEVVDGRAPRHRGVKMGVVKRVEQSSVWIIPTDNHKIAQLKPGDGVVFDSAGWRSPEEPEEGGRIYHVRSRKGLLELEFGNDAIRFDRIRPGDVLWRSDDPEIDKVAKPLTQAKRPVYQRPVNVTISAHENSPLILTWTLTDRPHISAVVMSDEPLGRAEKRGVTEAYLQDQLGRLGNTPYRLGEVEVDLSGNPFVPASLLNRLRREAVTQLQAKQANPPQVTLSDPLETLSTALDAIKKENEAAELAPQLHLLVRTPEQLAAALEQNPASITLDYLDFYGLGPAVKSIKAAEIEARVASPRILKPKEQRILNFLLRLESPILVRSAGLLHALRAAGTELPLIGDFSLNAANVLTADTFLNLGIERITPTHDLNGDQITELAERIGPDKIEALGYQHLPVFHTEHCVFCRFLSDGTSYKDCGKPCERHQVALRDVQGRSHPVMADVGCRNTVFGAEAQTAEGHLKRWLDVGIRHIRLEFVHESGGDVAAVSELFGKVLGGRMSYGEFGQKLAKLSPQGTTEGSLFVPDEFLRLPVL